MHVKHLIIIALFLISGYVYAQSYSSIKMEELGSEIPVNCLPSADSIFNCPEIVKTKSLVVNYNDIHEINHLGISLFSNETKELLNLPVCNFIERMMLELVLEKSNESLMQKLNRLKLNLLKNGSQFGELNFSSLSSVLDEIQHPAKFSLLREDNQFAAVWEYNQDDRFAFIFPASRDLIFGTDKKESDELLNKMLLGSGNFCNERNTFPGDVVREAELKFNEEKNIFTKKGAEFILPIVNANTYYQKTEEGAFELLFSKDFPEESFLNMIVKNQGNFDHKLHVTHRMYGNFSPDFDISLQEFLCYFRDDYDIYAAAQFSEPNKMKLTAVLRNRDYNFIHLMLVNAPVDNIFSPDGMLTAEFYSNIPQQSIRNFMGDITK